jgi:prepilin-type N-terminal cleavage/methylation domain-containing protein
MKDKGFTLLEVLVAAILISLALAAIAGVLNTGKYFLMRAEDEARAMSIAFAEKERLLSRSFSTLETGSSANCTWCTEPVNPIYTDYIQDGFNYTIEVKEERICDPADPNCIPVPFKNITIKVRYEDYDLSGLATGKYKRVSLQNMIPYPYVHFEPVMIDVACNVADGCSVPSGSGPAAYQIIGNLTHRLNTTVNYPVDKDIQVIYNLAINVENALGINGSDTIYTRCFVDGVGQDVEARTPIASQPSISNIIAVDDLARDTNHTIDIRWYKDTAAGSISLTRGSMVIVSFEDD